MQRKSTTSPTKMKKPAGTQLSNRTKLILAGLYLSKFDSEGLKRLGFRSFTEAFNVVGYALGSQPASIKNYRDEFDPLFPNVRKGWHKRAKRDYCLRVFDEYRSLDIDSFAGLIQSFVGYSENLRSMLPVDEESDGASSSFARRVATGVAAERYFESVQPQLADFREYSLEDTTLLGCGFDFRLRKPENDRFLAVEVKGLSGEHGSIALTPLEYDLAAKMRGRYCLFLVKNFQKAPYHEFFFDPLSGSLEFSRVERQITQVSWLSRA